MSIPMEIDYPMVVASTSTNTTNTTGVHINSLPDVVLRNLFSRFSLSELLELGKVCALWHDHQLRVYRQTRSATFLIGHGAYSLMVESPLVIKHRELLVARNQRPQQQQQQQAQASSIIFDPRRRQFEFNRKFRSSYSYGHEVIQFRMPPIALESLARVEHVTISINYDNFNHIHSEVSELLLRLAPGLKSLKLFLKTFYGSIRTLLSFVDHFDAVTYPQLEHLTLDLSNLMQWGIDGERWSASMSAQLPILTQQPHRLREFYFIADTRRSSISTLFNSLFTVDRMEALASSGSLQRIGICSNLALENCPNTIGDRFTTIPVQWTSSSLVNLSDHFRSLTHLQCKFTAQTLVEPGPELLQMLRHLAPLRQLISLTWWLSLLNSAGVDRGEFKLCQIEPTDISSIVPLRSVQILRLHLGLRFHSDVQSPLWASAFPCVQVLELYHKCWKWSDRHFEGCSHYSRSTGPKPSRFNLLTKLGDLLQAFKSMPRLHTIFTEQPVKKWSPSELE